MRRYTEKGRVVYDRPKHFWNRKDYLRVCKKSGLQIFWIPAGDPDGILDKVLVTYNEILSIDAGETPFTGGSFGGGGASRSFEGDISALERPITGLAFIIEEKESQDAGNE